MKLKKKLKKRKFKIKNRYSSLMYGLFGNRLDLNDLCSYDEKNIHNFGKWFQDLMDHNIKPEIRKVHKIIGSNNEAV